MFSEITQERAASMTPREKRWFDNVKKAFFESDSAYASKEFADRCLQAQCKAIDVAKTLRRSLRGESTDTRDNKSRYIAFLNCDIPDPESNGFRVELVDSRTGIKQSFSLAGLVYAIRCMIHENENLDASESPDYHILVSWDEDDRRVFGRVIGSGQIVINGHLMWKRLREVLAGFITSLDSLVALGNGVNRFHISVDPPLCSIKKGESFVIRESASDT